MSRGYGAVQREILDCLAELPHGQTLLVGDGGSSYRRAAHGLAARGEVVLVQVSVYGRRRLGVRRESVLERLRRAREQRMKCLFSWQQ